MYLVSKLILLVGLELLAATGKIVNFDNLAVGTMPPGWTAAVTDQGPPPRWEVRKDETAPTPPYVLAHVSSGSGNGHFPLAILDAVQLRDGEVSVRIKPSAGTDDHGGGIVWRYRDPRNYYLVRANAADQTVGVYRVQDGHASPVLKPVKHEIPPNSWTILKIVARGSRFQVYVDHRRILEGQDGAFSGPGKVGVGAVPESPMCFDDFRVNPR
jgi:hypothetical protein